MGRRSEGETSPKPAKRKTGQRREKTRRKKKFSMPPTVYGLTKRGRKKHKKKDKIYAPFPPKIPKCGKTCRKPVNFLWKTCGNPAPRYTCISITYYGTFLHTYV